MRTIIDLPQEQIDSLKEMSAETNASRAQLIRYAVHEYVQSYQASQSDSAFGIFKEQPIDSIEYQQNMRGEWEE